MKKSFTLIEVLVATFIFTVVVTIGMSALLMIMFSGSKIKSSKGVQESGRLGMELLSNEVKAANSEGADYNKFVILNILGGGMFGDFEEGPQLRINKDANEKTYGLYDGSGNLVDQTCSTNDCYLGVNIGGVPSRVTTTDISVETLVFSGYTPEKSVTPNKQPYVTIEMIVKSKVEDVKKNDIASFKTTVTSGSVYEAVDQATLYRTYLYIVDARREVKDGWLCKWKVEGTSITREKCMRPIYEGGRLTNYGAPNDIDFDGTELFATNDDGEWILRMQITTYDPPPYGGTDLPLGEYAVVTGYKEGSQTGGNALAVDDNWLYIGDDTGDWVCFWNKETLTYRDNNKDKACSIKKHTETGANGLFSDGEYLYVTDKSGGWIQKVRIQDQVQVALKDGSKTGGHGVTGEGDNLYVSDTSNNWICRWDAADAGLKKINCDPPSGLEGVSGGHDLETDGKSLSSAKYLYVVDTNPNRILQIDIANWRVANDIKGGDDIGGQSIAVQTEVETKDYNWRYE